ARHAPVAVLPAERPRACFLRAAAALLASPDEGVLARERGRHHALADRLEDLRLAQVRDQEPEREGRRAALRAHVRAGAGAPVDEAGALEIPYRTSHGDPGGAELPHEIRLAGQAVPFLPAAAQEDRKSVV